MKKGFTLVELLAVIILLGILLAFTYPKILNIAEKKTAEVDQAKIKLINSATLEYMNTKVDDDNQKVYDQNVGDEYCILLDDIDKENLIAVEIDDIKEKYSYVRVKIGNNNKNSYTLEKDCEA